jgi:hypothetical protein
MLRALVDKIPTQMTKANDRWKPSSGVLLRPGQWNSVGLVHAAPHYVVPVIAADWGQATRYYLSVEFVLRLTIPRIGRSNCDVKLS